MKKGFFLLEALLACMLISLLVGSMVHHYAQWSRSYKDALAREQALAILMALIEQRKKPDQSDAYNITRKTISIEVPDGAQMLMPAIVCPMPPCIEVIATVADDTHLSVSLIEGGYHAS